MRKCSEPKPINVADPISDRRCFLTDDDDEGDKRKSTLRPDNTAATKAAQKRKWEVSPYLSPLFSTLSLPLILSLPAFSNCSLFSKVLRRRRGGGSHGRNDFLKYIPLALGRSCIAREGGEEEGRASTTQVSKN